MSPANWPETVWNQILAILASYIRKWSGPDSPKTLSPDERDEVRSRIIMDIMAGECPDDITPLHYVFRVARRWRMREWAGDTETNKERMRKARASARKALRDPGSMESEEGRNKSPFRGSSADSKAPTPLAMMIAAEEMTSGRVWYVSDRQRKGRRRPVKGNPGPVKFRTVPVGFVGRPRVGFGRNGRPLYFPGAASRIAYLPLAPECERGEYDRKTRKYREYVSHVGYIPNREIGKVKCEAATLADCRAAFWAE